MVTLPAEQIGQLKMSSVNNQKLGVIDTTFNFHLFVTAKLRNSKDMQITIQHKYLKDVLSLKITSSYINLSYIHTNYLLNNALMENTYN